MDKTTRAAIEKATQRARKLLEADFGEQLEEKALPSFPTERRQKLLRKALVKAGADPDAPLQPSGLAGLSGNPDQLRDGPAPSSR